MNWFLWVLAVLLLLFIILLIIGFWNIRRYRGGDRYRRKSQEEIRLDDFIDQSDRDHKPGEPKENPVSKPKYYPPSPPLRTPPVYPEEPTQASPAPPRSYPSAPSFPEPELQTPMKDGDWSFGGEYKPLSHEEPVSYTDEVNLALSYPRNVKLLEDFTIRVSAYMDAHTKKLQTFLGHVAPDDTHLMEVDYCKWQRGTIITVRVYSPLLVVDPPVQEFEWEGKMKVLSFDAKVQDNAVIGDRPILKVDVSIANITIARLRAEMVVGSRPSVIVDEVIGKPIKTAFASYASADTNSVIGRLSEIERNGVKIFWDRMNLQTGADWKNQLCAAIETNESFLLFWSSNAKASEWVEWEWKTALACKGINGIEPHPLESPDVAPPPPELSSLHFDDKYLYFRKG